MSAARHPYKGLLFYTAEDSDVFAARDKDAVRCARLLTSRASVLMLHGRTGCGKSSFLRAALKPLLDRTDTGLWFAAGSGFRVVRSGLTPLREVAGAVFDLVSDPKAIVEGVVTRADLEPVLAGCSSREAFVEHCGNDFDRMMKSLSLLGARAAGTPILVIDQAEEIFTLREERKGKLKKPFGTTKAEDGSPGNNRRAAGRELSEREIDRAQINYLNLLRAVAANPPGVKLLVSLRTEYKGAFDDKLRLEVSPEASMRIAGFHLEDLDEDGLISAIKKPTEVTDGAGNSLFHFDYEEGVAEAIIDRLLAPDAVPMGGVLPTLQVVCLRLYEQTRRSKTRSAADVWRIQKSDLDRLGKNVDNQIEVYLRERLEDMFLKFSLKQPSVGGAVPELEETDRTRGIDQWYRLLEKLVRVQGDGRAVTKQLTDAEIREWAHTFQCRFPEDGLDYLEKEGLLKVDDSRTPPVWTLRHDSLGLAIQRWAVTYKQSLDSGTMMDMNSPRQSAKIEPAQLFPDGKPPATFTIHAPVDKLWDHQIPYFARARRLSTRVGIEFVEDSSLSLAGIDAGARVLVAAERAAFPPERDRSQWTDIGVSDLFLGNGLVGPPIGDLKALRPIDITIESDLFNAMRQRLLLIVEHLRRTNAHLFSYDESAKSMMKLACRLAGSRVDLRDDQFKTRTYKPGLNDELFAQFIEQKNDQSVFMIGTAYGRALAAHRGYVTYFDCMDLIRLMELQTKLERDGIDTQMPSDHNSRAQLFRLYQNSFFHTVWQINVPAAEWRSIEHYPLVMRLAGLCYFTADYIRSFADDFVRHLYDWHARSFHETEHVSRETIREMLQDCFQFLTFEENPRVLFDPDSRSEFSPREPRNEDQKLASTVREIHVELTKLRTRTVDHFADLTWQLEQLRQLERPGLEAARVQGLEQAKALRQMAWDNFRIYNFYDSARLMDQARAMVREVADQTVAEKWESQATADRLRAAAPEVG